jgi:putative endonuclease
MENQKNSPIHNQAVGRLGEQIARDYLIKNGCKIITTNYHTRQGEIDIVCAKGTTLIFVEVKTRQGLMAGYPEEAVTPQKQRRLEMAIEQFLAADEECYSDIQSKIIAIHFRSSGKHDVQMIDCE